MTIDFEEDGYVTINMKDYVQKILDEIPFGMKGKATTPAATYLFDVNCNCPKLTEDESQFFSLHGSQIIIFMQKGLPRHSNPNCFSHHKRQGTRW